MDEWRDDCKRKNFTVAEEVTCTAHMALHVLFSQMGHLHHVQIQRMSENSKILMVYESISNLVMYLQLL